MQVWIVENDPEQYPHGITKTLKNQFPTGPVWFMACHRLRVYRLFRASAKEVAPQVVVYNQRSLEATSVPPSELKSHIVKGDGAIPDAQIVVYQRAGTQLEVEEHEYAGYDFKLVTGPISYFGQWLVDLNDDTSEDD